MTLGDLQLPKLLPIIRRGPAGGGLLWRSDVNHDRGQERQQASTERHAEKSNGRSVWPEQSAADESA